MSSLQPLSGWTTGFSYSAYRPRWMIDTMHIHGAVDMVPWRVEAPMTMEIIGS